MNTGSWTPLEQSRFEATVARGLPALHRLARRLERSDADGDDLVQETLERAWRDRLQVGTGAGLAAWLERAVVRQAVDSLAQELARSLDDPHPDQQLLPDVGDLAALRERAGDQKAVREGLRQLPFADRLTVVLCDGEGWSLTAVAELLRAPQGDARGRLKRARVRLIAALDPASRQPAVGEERCRPYRVKAQALLDGELPAGEQGPLEDHLRTCGGCAASLLAATAVWEGLAQRPLAHLGEELRQALAAVVEGQG